MLSRLIERVLEWSRRPRAVYYLAAVSFAESSFFPIPPDLLLAPMVLSRRDLAWRLAAWTTVWSVVGGVAALVAAELAIDHIGEILQRVGHWDSYLRARGWFGTWGFWAVLIAGFSPIPYKVFAIAAGAMSMFLPAFILASIAGRGGRFFLVAGMMSYGGPSMQGALKRHVDRIGWATVAVVAVMYLFLQLRG